MFTYLFVLCILLLTALSPGHADDAWFVPVIVTFMVACVVSGAAFISLCGFQTYLQWTWGVGTMDWMTKRHQAAVRARRQQREAATAAAEAQLGGPKRTTSATASAEYTVHTAPRVRAGATAPESAAFELAAASTGGAHSEPAAGEEVAAEGQRDIDHGSIPVVKQDAVKGTSESDIAFVDDSAGDAAQDDARQSSEVEAEAEAGDHVLVAFPDENTDFGAPTGVEMDGGSASEQNAAEQSDEETQVPIARSREMSSREPRDESHSNDSAFTGSIAHGAQPILLQSTVSIPPEGPLEPGSDAAVLQRGE